MPSVVIAIQPQYLTPVNGDVSYVLTSTDYNLSQFKYLAKVFSYLPNQSTQNEVGTVEYAPAPDGSGFIQIGHILRQYVQPRIDLSINRIASNEEMATAYRIQSGFRWNPQLSYGYNQNFAIGQTGAFMGAPIPQSEYPNVKKPAGFNWDMNPSVTYYYLRLKIDLPVGSPGHTILANDKIYISKALRGFNGYYQGESIVRSVGFSTGSTQLDFIELKVLFSGDYNVPGSLGEPINNYSTYQENGFITMVERYTNFSNKAYAWNGCPEYTQLGLTNWQNVMQVHSSLLNTAYPVQRWLSNFNLENDWKPIYADQRETVSFLHNFNNNGDTLNQVRVIWRDRNKQFLGVAYYTTGNISISTYTEFSLQTGLMTYAGIPYSDVKFYEVAVGNGGSGSTINGNFSIPAKYEVKERNCNIKNRRLVWLNETGGYEYFNFSLQGGESTQVSKTEFKRYDGFSSNLIGFKQTLVQSVDVTENVTAVSDWVTEAQKRALKSLVYSVDAYEVLDDNNQYLIPIIVTSESFDQDYDNQGKLFNMTVTYKYAHRKIVQNQ